LSVGLVAGIAGLLMTALLVVLTVLPLSNSKAWWVRMWDFPRLQIAVAMLPAAALSLAGPWRWVALPPLAACLAYQLWRIRPYTPLVRTEMRFAQGKEPDREVRLLAANVLMENEAHEKVMAFIAAQDPDVLFLMETDARWIAALEPVLARYPTVLREPRGDYYGLVFATRLAAKTARTLRLSLDDTPSVLAELTAPDGVTEFRFVGLHPRPPVPGQDTDERDAEVLYAARFACRSGVPVVAMGDFNDAAWSDTSQRFKHVGDYVDPRIGRGLYASFNANHWLIRCPIDQLFVTTDVAVVSFGRGPHVGSDHFPIIATLRFDPELAERLNRAPVPLTGDVRADVEAGVSAHGDRLEAAHGREDYWGLH
jgi:endonuclease/exonuclease/phosphatase (EEP) superfamily protein YafD